MNDSPTFADLVDFLADRRARNVYVEIGLHDHEGPENSDLFLLKLHGYRLGKVEDATDYSSRERRGLMLWLERREPRPDGDSTEGVDSTRVFITPRRVTKIEGDPARALKVWMDDSVYVSFSAT
jgi:hypothetical protein